MKIKAIFLDVDGTLVSFDTHRVPQSAIEALRHVHKLGIKVIIATGRPFTNLHEIEEVPYEAVIALNGANCVLRDGTSISQKLIDKEDFYKVQELAKLVDHPVPPVVDIEEEFAKGECCQLCIYCDEETEKKVMAQLPGLTISRWNPFFADVNVAGINKAVGINELASYYGFDISQTLAFGDGGNDIAMLRAVGTGIAMGNASDIVKAAADYVTGTVDENGIRDALIHWGVMQE